MTYWGTAYWPSRLPPSTVKIRDIISTASSKSLFEVPTRSKRMTNKAKSSNKLITTFKPKVSIENKAKSNTSIFPVEGMRLTAHATTSAGVSKFQPNLSKKIINKATAKAEIDHTKELIKTAESVCIPIVVAPDIYLWQCFEKIDKDNYTSEVKRDCN